MMMMQVSAILAVLSCIAVTVSGLPGGAPAGACPMVAPNPVNHGAESQPLDTLPYQLNLSQFPARPDGSAGFGYIPGQSVIFSVTAGENQTGVMFRGVLVRAVQYMDMDNFVGTFEVVDATNTQLSACSPPESGITHTANSDKSTVYMRFIPPPVGTGPIGIRYAVVQTRTVYWASALSSPIVELPVPTTTAAPENAGAEHLHAAGFLFSLVFAMFALLF